MDDEEKLQRMDDDIRMSFKISYNGTKQNKDIHARFQRFCLEQTDNSYILGIDKLLNAYDTDWKYESLFAEIKHLREIVERQQEQLEKRIEKKEVKTFG